MSVDGSFYSKVKGSECNEEDISAWESGLFIWPICAYRAPSSTVRSSTLGPSPLACLSHFYCNIQSR